MNKREIENLLNYINILREENEEMKRENKHNLERIDILRNSLENVIRLRFYIRQRDYKLIELEDKVDKLEKSNKGLILYNNRLENRCERYRRRLCVYKGKSE